MKYSNECKQLGIPYLYPWQELIVDKIYETQNKTAYRIIILPTGAGKSLCFTLPVLFLSGLTIVVYPLLSLMNDQKRRMDELGIPTGILRGGQTKAQRKTLFEACYQGKIKILITNPESLFSPMVLGHLSEWKVCHLVADEAHCLEDWGMTFRPRYLEWKHLMEALPHIPVTAFTATAGPKTIETIKTHLFQNQFVEVLQATPDRPNINYRVGFGINFELGLLPWIKKLEKPLVVFCRDRKKTRALALQIREALKTDEVYFYHAGLTKEEREKVEAWFYSSPDGILTATNGYGMGVDKKNIRSVIHWGPPPSVQAYLQESGRAGRDGNQSKAVMLYDPTDKRITAEMNGYLATKDCRRKYQIESLGSILEYCHGCDLCEGTSENIEKLRNQWKSWLRLVHCRVDRTNLIRLLWGKPVPLLNDAGWKDNHPVWGLLESSSYAEIEKFLDFLVRYGVLNFPENGLFKGLAQCQFFKAIPTFHTKYCERN